jgi:hypothetical protein
VAFRLTSPDLDFFVDVRLRDFGGRWLAVADIAGEWEMGLGRTARYALVASLSSLGPKAVKDLLADPRLQRVRMDH